jgi:hypothetical protein
MAIDEPNQGLSSEDKQIYSDLGLTDTPFENVRYYYPYSKSDVAKVQSYAAPSDIEQQKRDKKAFTYKFTFADNKDKLDLLLANEEDPTNTLEACANFIMNEEGKFKNIEKWETLKETIDEYTKAGGTTDEKKEIQVVSWRKFKRCIRKAISNDVFGKSLVNEVDLTNEIQNHVRANNVMMIDIARLDGNTQSFVFGTVAPAIYDFKLDGERNDIPDKIILFVD